ncbi:uncharacterized protein CTRU02_214836 [Colletotrichum truncatum]|uniref:Uncharacterized protein n=1 Tax=Colletotrichum truncatum TaxID=5467 RepID=A0ACC3YE00_COLTU
MRPYNYSSSLQFEMKSSFRQLQHKITCWTKLRLAHQEKDFSHAERLIEDESLLAQTPQANERERAHSIPHGSRTTCVLLVWKLLKSLLFLAAVGFVIEHLLSIERNLKNDSTPRNIHAIPDCGHDTASARAAGCVYDIMMVGWSAPQCFNPFVSADSLSNSSTLADVRGAGSFTFSVTPDFTQIVRQDVGEITKHEYLYANWEFHKAHCAYVWRVLANALERKRRGELNVYVYMAATMYEHSVHCSHVLLDKKRNLTAPTQIQVSGTNRCILL